jgi:ParB/RepB/Spo0J family partition protein
MGELKKIAVSEIRENPVALRTVNRDDEKYLGLVESIRTKGFNGAITVRPKQDKETGQDYYELVDGLHRFSATKDAGLEEINVDVVDLTDDETLESQIMFNIHKIETKPVEYSRQMLRILSSNPMMTEAELAGKLGKSPQWIHERLGLVKIDNEKIALLINEGKIGLANAYALAKLPPEEMDDFVDRAMTMAPDEFVPAANTRMKEIREAKRKGENAADAVFQPVAFMQKMKEIKDELEAGQIAGILCDGLSTAEEGFAMAVKWALHLDPKSVEAQVAKDDERKAAREEAKKKKATAKAEKLKEKADKAVKEAAAAAEETATEG